jgi:hypothetical protein
VINAGPLTATYQKAVWVPSGFGQILSDHRARVVINAPGTLTVVNLKVKVGASAAVAAITNNNTDRTSSNVLPLFIVFSWVNFLERSPARIFFNGIKSGSDCTPDGSQHDE